MRLPVLLSSLLLAAAPARAAVVRGVELPSGPLAPPAPLTAPALVGGPAAGSAASPALPSGLGPTYTHDVISVNGPASAPAGAPALPATMARPWTYDVVSERAAEASPKPAVPSEPARPDASKLPADAGRLFDGSAARRGSVAPDDLPSLEPAAQLDASGFYATVAERHPWAQADEPGSRWLGFYRELYRSLSASLPAGHPYRSQTPRGPVFFVGGSDVAMALLGLPRSQPDAPVNLFARSAGADPFSLWTEVRVKAAGKDGADAEVGLDPGSTLSLVRMAKAREAGAAEALDAAHANVLLKWHALALTPDGLEVRALDGRSAEDLREGRLRLSEKLGPLDGYELHYDLILAYRALEESPRAWRLEPRTQALISAAARTLPPEQVGQALSLAADAVAHGRGVSKKEAVKRLLWFASRRLGPEAREALARAAAAPPDEEGALTPRQARDPRPGSRAELARLSAPWRTAEHLERLAREPRAPEETFRFALIGDAEPGRFWMWRRLFNVPGVFWRQLAAADRQPVDFIVQLGDMVSRGILRNFLEFFRRLAALGPRRPYLTVIGNHDRRSPHGVSDDKLYRSLFGKTEYYFDRGGWRFVVLDNSAQRLRPEQLRWLDQALDTPLRKVVFTHVPPSTIGEWTDFGRLKGVGGFKRGADAFTELVARRGVERVYVGHVHALDAREHRGVTYVLTGGGGSPLYPTKAGEARHHWLVVEAGPDGLREEVHSLDGEPEPLVIRRK